LFVMISALLRRYKRCPSDRILVVYGKVGSSSSAKCIHGGAAFVWPIIQDYSYLDLTPISIEVNLTNALSRQNIRVDVPSRFTVGISTEPGNMNNAAERLLGLNQDSIHDLAKDIIFGQLRLVVATMDIEEINNNRDKFLSNVANNVEAEIKKIGMKLINVNVTDIKDESGYIEALGKEAAAKAINDARKSVAEKDRDGSIGEAQALKEQRIEVAAANADAKIGEADAHEKERIAVSEANSRAQIGEAEAESLSQVGKAEATSKASIGEAESNARAVEGRNLSGISIAKSNAQLREEEAEANRRAQTAEKVSTARAQQDAYQAQEEAEKRRAARDEASQEADILVPARIAKQKVEIEAEAEAERKRIDAQAEADALFAKMEAEAKGVFETLMKQSEGFAALVEAAGSYKGAVMMMIAEKLPELVKTQVEAIKNIKIDKVTVWDSGQGKDGNNSTADFLSGMMKSVPPLEELFNMAGMTLPNYLKGQEGKDGQEGKFHSYPGEDGACRRARRQRQPGSRRRRR